MSRWIKVVFIISLALNLGILGMFVGRHFIKGKGGYHYFGVQHYLLRSLPEEKHAQVEKILTKYKQMYPRKRGRFIRDWPEFAEILREETFDREKFLQKFNQKLEKHNQRWRDGGAAIADIAELLSNDERIVIIEKIQKWYDRKKNRRRWFGSRQ